MDTDHLPGTLSPHLHPLNGALKESKILAAIRASDYTDTVQNNKLVEFIREAGNRGEADYGLSLCKSVEAGLSRAGMSESVTSFQIKVLTAHLHLLLGHDNYHETELETILARDDLPEELLEKIQSVLSMTHYARGQISDAVDTALSILPRLEKDATTRLRVALTAATYMSLAGDNGNAAALLGRIIEESAAGVTSVTPMELAVPRVILAFTSLESGNYEIAKLQLDELNVNVFSMDRPDVHNAIVYVNALSEAATKGIELGRAIQLSSKRFVLGDESLLENQIYRAWLMVQSGKLGVAHAMFKNLCESPQAPTKPAAALLGESALMGYAYTSRELNFAEDARETLKKLYRLHASEDLMISTSQMLNGIELVLMSKETGIQTRLQAIRNLRRRGQYSHGSSVPLVQRAIEIECNILNDGGLSNDELSLRLLLVELEPQSIDMLRDHHLRNRLHLASLYTDMAAADTARSILLPVLGQIDVVCGENDELSLFARYVSFKAGLDNMNMDSIDIMTSLQRDIERNLGAAHPLNDQALFFLAKAWQLAGNNEMCLDHLLSIESGSGFATSNRNFKLEVMSEVGDTLSKLGQYKRAAKWYKLCVKLPASKYERISITELENLVKYGEALAKAGDFRSSRDLFELIPIIVDDPVHQHVDLLTRAKASAAASAESMGAHELAATEYSALITLMTEREEFFATSIPLASLYISVGRNLELINDQTQAFKHYDLALDQLIASSHADHALIEEIMWRRDCCRMPMDI